MFSELKYAVRSLAKTPWLAAVVIITLAVGIGANTTVFSWVRGVLLNPLHGVADGQRLVSLEQSSPDGEYDNNSSYPDFRDFRDSSRSLAGALAYQYGPLSLGNDDQAERVWAEFVSANFFDVLGVRPVAGRFFQADEQEEAPGKYPVAVISARFWRGHFHSDPQVIGKTIRVNRQQLTVIGVAPTEFFGTVVGLSFDLWVPLAMDPFLNEAPDWFENRGDRRGLRLWARLKPGVSLLEARTEIQTIARRLAQSYPRTNEGIGATLVPMDQATQGLQSLIGTLLETLLGAGAILLLIVCANVANLMLVRATTRQKEFSIRLALGASRQRVIGQLLLESLLLAGLGGLAGVLLARQMVSWLRFFIPAKHFPLAVDFPPDFAVLLFSLSISVLVGLLFGLAPALQTIRNDRLSGLSGRGAIGDTRAHRLRGILVISEVALALVVLIGASLFVESFRHTKQVDPGFDSSNVLLAPLNLTEAGYSTEQGTLFMRHLRARIEALPGVRAVSFADNVPLGFADGPKGDVQVGGYAPRRGENMSVRVNPIWPGYFDLMRIGLIEGRDFTERDDNQSPSVAIINETFARRYFRGQEPVGRQVQLWGPGRTVVGVVKDIKYRSLAETPRPYLYLPMQQAWVPGNSFELHVRTVGPPQQFLPELRREFRSVDPRVHLFEMFTLSDYIGEASFAQRIGAALLGILGTLALLLAALGLFSVMAYSVSQRTQEIGIRMALGAQTSDVFRPVLGRALKLAMAGVGIGLALSFALTRIIAGQLLGVSATDPLTFVGVSCLLCAVALAASYIPARRAAKVDPLIALRAE
jgi:predicted permease